MTTGLSAVPSERMVPLTWMSVPVSPDATPLSKTRVPGWMVSVVPAGTMTSAVTWTTPLQVTAAPESVPETVVTGSEARLVIDLPVCWVPTEAVSVKLAPLVMPGPLRVTRALPRPLRSVT